MTDNVQVAVRVRPFNERERNLESASCIRMMKETQQTIIVDPETNAEKVFTFDYSYNSFVQTDDPEFASQDVVWNDIGLKVLEHAWNGFNVSLFAYGQTGAGKSFSMVGYGSDVGIIPRASEMIFHRIDENTSETSFKVEASMMEIYNERVKDLFNPALDNLKVRDHPRHGPYAEGLTRSAVSSYAEISRLMDAGILARTTASTNMNATSSRAHTIFQIIVTQSEPNPSTGKIMEKVSRINLIDLAGSERAASTGATGARLKEGAAINQSLSALGNCISALADISNGKKKVLVPYRNSKLTHLLKDSLGGNSKTIMIAALSPASVNYSETLSTLRYADRAKQIKNKAVVNEDPNQLLIRQLKEELENLRKAMLENSDFRPQSRGGGMNDSTRDFGISTPPPDTARQQEVASIREQLEEHQRLLQESEKTWAERLKETEELAKQREQQLQLLGLAADSDDMRLRSLKEPHLLNLHEDRVMTEKLRYFLHCGDNRVGRADADSEQSIVIGGLGILKEHCLVTREQKEVPSSPDDNNHHTRDAITIRGLGNARVFVNGNAVSEGTSIELHHCDRLILGNSNVFRIVIPSARTSELTDGMATEESQFDWQLAVKELHNSQIKINMELEAAAEREKQEMDDRVKKMTEMMEQEKKLSEERFTRQREEWNEHVRQLSEQMKAKEMEIKSQMQAEEDDDKRRLAEQLALQESKLAEELVRAEIVFERKQKEMAEKQKSLESSLQKQMWEAKLLGRRKERERLERVKFDDELLRSIPLINEANSIAEELQRPTCFVLRLIASGPTIPGLSLDSGNQEEEEVSISESITPELRVQVNFQEAGTFRSVLWDVEFFHDNLYVMREMYQAFIENNRELTAVTSWQEANGVDSDPFYEAPQPQIIGKSFIFLRNLCFGCKISESTPIFDTKGQANGNLKCEITPSVLSHEWQARQHQLVDDCPSDVSKLELPTLSELIGANLRVNIFVEQLRGIPGKLCKDACVKFQWLDPLAIRQAEDRDDAGDDEANGAPYYTSDPAVSPSVDPQINFNVVIERQITSELIGYLQTSPLEFEVYGIVPSNNLNKVASRAIDLRNATPRETDGNDENGSVEFFDADSDGRNRLLGKMKSVRRRKGKYLAADEDMAVLLEQCKEQLIVQSQTLAENTQELEIKIELVAELQQRLDQEERRRRDLEEALENMNRTNKLMQAKLQQQILKDVVGKVSAERKLSTIVDAVLVPTRNTARCENLPMKSQESIVEGSSSYADQQILMSATPEEPSRDTDTKEPQNNLGKTSAEGYAKPSGKTPDTPSNRGADNPSSPSELPALNTGEVGHEDTSHSSTAGLPLTTSATATEPRIVTSQSVESAQHSAPTSQVKTKHTGGGHHANGECAIS